MNHSSLLSNLSVCEDAIINLLELVKPRLQICSHPYGNAVAAIKADGTVVTWGNPEEGGDCDAVRDQLLDLQSIQASLHAFAAIKADGTVVTLGQS